MKRLLRSIPVLRTPVFRWVSLLGLLAMSLVGIAAPPAWWAQRGVLSNQLADDFAPANQGQLKNMAAKAWEELESKLPGGAGPAVTELVAGWRLPVAPGVVRDDYSAVNLGQLKHVARPFYDRLIEAGFTDHYPWSASLTPANDFAAANLGQLKSLFSFDLSMYDSGDGLPSGWKLAHFGRLDVDASADPDGDGLTNLQEYQAGSNPNGYSTGGSGFSDSWAVSHGLNPSDPMLLANADFDNDGLTNSAEYALGTDPLNPDTDGDGIPDRWEIEHWMNPLDPNDAEEDWDLDGLTNREEYLAGTNPSNYYTDNDGIPDGWEVAFGMNPLDPSDAGQDWDGDGLSNLTEYIHGTNPLDPDTDGDGMPDGWEVAHLLNPLDSNDAWLDRDGDGLVNIEEYLLETDITLVDSDGDGVPDGWERQHGMNPLAGDSGLPSGTGTLTFLQLWRRESTPVATWTFSVGLERTDHAFTLHYWDAGLGAEFTVAAGSAALAPTGLVDFQGDYLMAPGCHLEVSFEVNPELVSGVWLSDDTAAELSPVFPGYTASARELASTPWGVGQPVGVTGSTPTTKVYFTLPRSREAHALAVVLENGKTYPVTKGWYLWDYAQASDGSWEYIECGVFTAWADSEEGIAFRLVDLTANQIAPRSALNPADSQWGPIELRWGAMTEGQAASLLSSAVIFVGAADPGSRFTFHSSDGMLQGMAAQQGSVQDPATWNWLTGWTLSAPVGMGRDFWVTRDADGAISPRMTMGLGNIITDWSASFPPCRNFQTRLFQIGGARAGHVLKVYGPGDTVTVLQRAAWANGQANHLKTRNDAGEEIDYPYWTYEGVVDANQPLLVWDQDQPGDGILNFGEKAWLMDGWQAWQPTPAAGTMTVAMHAACRSHNLQVRTDNGWTYSLSPAPGYESAQSDIIALNSIYIPGQPVPLQSEIRYFPALPAGDPSNSGQGITVEDLNTAESVPFPAGTTVVDLSRWNLPPVPLMLTISATRVNHELWLCQPGGIQIRVDKGSLSGVWTAYTQSSVAFQSWQTFSAMTCRISGLPHWVYDANTHEVSPLNQTDLSAWNAAPTYSGTNTLTDAQIFMAGTNATQASTNGGGNGNGGGHSTGSIGGTSGTATPANHNPAPANIPSFAAKNAEYEVMHGETREITLSVYQPAPDGLTYTWVENEGPKGTVTGLPSPVLTYKATGPGNYDVFKFVATAPDGQRSSVGMITIKITGPAEPGVSITAYSPGRRVPGYSGSDHSATVRPSTTGTKVEGEFAILNQNTDNDDERTAAEGQPEPRDNDDQKIGPLDDDIVMIEVSRSIPDPDPGGTLTLTVPAGVRVFNEDGTIRTASAGDIDLDSSRENRLFLEGLPGIDGGELTATYRPPDGDPVVAKVGLLQAELVPDSNHDETIDANDKGKVTEKKPWSFWLNDDNDELPEQEDQEDQEPEGCQGPASPSASASPSALNPAQRRADYNTPNVNGMKDLKDFFPLFFDIQKVLKAYPPGASVTYTLSQADEAVNFVETNKPSGNVSQYKYDGVTTGIGTNEPLASAGKRLVTAAGVELSAEFLNNIKNENRGIIFFEGRAPTRKPLVLTVKKGGRRVLTVSLPLSLGPRILLLLHGMNSSTATWDDFVKAKFGGRVERWATDIVDGGIQDEAPFMTKNGVRCYRVRFGRYEDQTTARKGLDGLTADIAPNYLRDDITKCGDFETFAELGKEVDDAIKLLFKRYGNGNYPEGNIQIVLLGHSRGGIAARQFLQGSNASKKAVVAMLTTGTPHLGGRLGRIYKWLAENKRPPAGIPDADWRVVDFLITKGLDVRRPVIGDLVENSAALGDLNDPIKVRYMPRNIRYGEIMYQKASLGVLKLGPLHINLYSVFHALPGLPPGVDPLPSLSPAARAYILGAGKTPEAYAGDGLINSAENQRFTKLPGFDGKRIPELKDDKNFVLHADEPKKFADLHSQLKALMPTWFPLP